MLVKTNFFIRVILCLVLAYLNGVTCFSDGDNNGLLGLFLAEPNPPFLGLDGLYILFGLYDLINDVISAAKD